MPEATYEVTVTADTAAKLEEWRHWLEKTTDGHRSHVTVAITRVHPDEQPAEITTATNHNASQ